MQPSLKEIAEILAERAGRQFDAAFLAEMKVVVAYWRSRLIVDSLNSRPKDRKFFTRWIEIPLIEVPISQFEGFPECATIMRTECEVFSPIRANSKLFDYIGKLDRMNLINLYEPYEVKDLASSRYTGDVIRAMRINGYIYIAGPGANNIPGLAISGIPEDLEDYNRCCNKCSSECYDDDKPYPASQDIIQRIIQAALSTELRIPVQPETKEVVIDGK